MSQSQITGCALPAPILVSRSSSSSLKLRLEQCSSSIPESVPEENEAESSSNIEDDSLSETDSDESDCSTSPSSRSLPKDPLAQRRVDVAWVDNRNRLALSCSTLMHHEPERLFAEQLDEARRLHEQDKDFFTREIRNLRMVLFDIEATLKERTEELQFIMQEREKDVMQWETTKRDMERRAELAMEDLKGKNEALQRELYDKEREYLEALEVLQETQKELLGIPVGNWEVSHPPTAGSSGVETAGERTDLTTTLDIRSSRAAPSALLQYVDLPNRVSNLRRRLLQDEQRFQSAYAAWSNESKHTRRMHQKQLNTLSEGLKTATETSRRLSEENKKLESRLESCKSDVMAARRESQLLSASQRSREVQQPSTHAGLSLRVQDRLSVSGAVKRVQKLNVRIGEAAEALAGWVRGTDETPKVGVGSVETVSDKEGRWLLCGMEKTTFRATKESFNENALIRSALLCILTTWCGHHAQSWDLSPHSAWTSENPLVAVFRKISIVEDPSVVASWRSLTKAHLKFSSNTWSRALISSLHSAFSYLGVSYTKSIAVMEKDLEPLLQSLCALREALGELIVSKELEIATVCSGARFDYRLMKDAYPGGLAESSPSAPGSQGRKRLPIGQPERVFVTCGLGLKVKDGIDGERLLSLPLVLREAAV